ncbi:MAG TPA: M28 family peptidase [Candidatus Sulfotelmatobacter sp.]|nr:M28 family peptidase [Candidatus Sulfotelmatobacter sp.]
MGDFETAAGAIWASPRITEDFTALCACGGRFAGTESERRACEFMAQRLAEATGGTVRREPVPYLGWDREPARLELADGRGFAACALGRSPATPAGGLHAEVIDLGRGIPADFTLASDQIRGRIVLVRHEFYMASGHIHRRRKYELAKAAGAVGFLIACHLPGGLLVTGSGGGGGADEIPSAGISHEAGVALAQAGGAVRLEIGGRFVDRVAENLLVDIPGRTDEWVVLSAHLDGHDFAQSAMDNGSGLISALAAAEALRDIVPRRRRGLRVAFFNVEEWWLIGSRVHLERLDPRERGKLAFNVNLDSVAGASRLAVMTSGIPAADAILDQVNRAYGLRMRRHRPFMSNSDHASFIEAGVPALRLCAGLDEPESNLRFLLTPGDTPDKVDPTELKAAATATAALVLAAIERDLAPLDAAAIDRTVNAV